MINGDEWARGKESGEPVESFRQRIGGVKALGVSFARVGYYESVFSGDFLMDNCEGDDIFFHGCVFEAGVSVSHCKIAKVHFFDCSFTGHLHISGIPSLSIIQSEIKRSAYLGEMSGLEIHACRVNDGRMLVIEACGVVNTDRIAVGKGAAFELNKCSPKNVSRFSVESGGRVNMMECDLRTSTLSLQDYSAFVFVNVKWPLVDGRKSIFNEAAPGSTELTIKVYRRLINSLEASRDYELAEDFYFREMSMTYRDRFHGVFGRLLGSITPLGIYGWSSKYGTSHLRALLILALLIFAVFPGAFLLSGLMVNKSLVASSVQSPATINYDLGFSPSQGLPLPTLDHYGAALTATLTVATLQKEKPYLPIGIDGSILASACIVIIALQSTLLAFALRRRFRRSSI